MPLNTTEAVDFVRDLASNENIKVSVKGAATGGIAVGCAAAAGALLLGPVGLAVGGVVGGVGAAVAMRDRFMSVPQAIAHMSPAQKQALACQVETIMRDVNATDVIALGAMVAGSTAMRGRVIEEILQFISQEIQLSVAN